MALSSTKNLQANPTDDTFVKYSLIRMACLFNMHPTFNKDTNTLAFDGYVNSQKGIKHVQISLNKAEIPQVLATDAMINLKQVHNCNAKFYDEKSCYDSGLMYQNLSRAQTFAESYPEKFDPQDYVQGLLAMAKNASATDAEWAEGYLKMVGNIFAETLGYISQSNWPNKDALVQNLNEYWKVAAAQLAGQPAEQME